MNDRCVSSGLKTADAAICAKPCLLYGVLLITNGAADATLILYDNASAASGTETFKAKIAAADIFGGVTYENPVECFNGIYADVTGEAAGYIVYYKPL